jgi:hypothetical protein
MVATCSLLGLGIGAMSGQAATRQCATRPTDDCLTQTPWLKLIEGMGQGLLVGTCAAIGASWNALKEDS